MSFDMETEYYTVFKDGKMLSATSKNTMNEKQRSYSTVKLLEDHYRVNVDKKERIERGVIPESIATIYFEPPKNGRIFSERHGMYCAVEKQNPSHYTLIKPDNRENHYFYENGVCTRVEVNLALATIRLEKVN
jgi:hypothetical protein